jgi:hypothetical protein
MPELKLGETMLTPKVVLLKNLDFRFGERPVQVAFNHLLFFYLTAIHGDAF